MSSADTTRERRSQPVLKSTTAPNTSTSRVSATSKANAEDSSFNPLDIARVIVFVLLASAGVSYFVTKESFTWGIGRPNWTRPEVVKSWISGPVGLTDEDLKQFDGTDPSKPLYLAINGTIYDVSAGRKHYGPGGSYHFFAGADSSRSFVTSCFADDRTPDMRGVEQMYLPLDDPEIDALYTKAELKNLKQQELRKAKMEVDKALRHWTEFFEGSKKYAKVGKVRREKGWATKGKPHPLCKTAQEGRQKRERPAGK